MKRIESGNPDRLTYRQPPALFTWLFTVPMMAGVIYMMRWIAFGPNGFVTLGLPDGTLTLVVAVVMVVFCLRRFNEWFVRVGVTVDRAAGTITREWGFFIMPLLTRTKAIADCHTLNISGVKHLINGTWTSSTYYLDAIGPGRSRMLIGRNDDKDKMIAVANDLGQFADLRIIDHTYDPPQVLRERATTMRALDLVAKYVMKQAEAEQGANG